MSLLEQIRTMARAKQGQPGQAQQPQGDPTDEALQRFMATIGQARGQQATGAPGGRPGAGAGVRPGAVRPGGVTPGSVKPQGRGLPQGIVQPSKGAGLASVLAGRGASPANIQPNRVQPQPLRR